jgi:hypothetical protein
MIKLPVMTKASYIIGRGGDIMLYDDTVSRRHARLDVGGDALYLVDLDSRNGTYELRGKELIAFRGGAITRDQVFAFGECVRSVVQLLAEVGAEPAAAKSSEGGQPERRHDTTMIGLAPVQRLSVADIVALLERAEDALTAGGELPAICRTLGISEARYERWCRDYGATRAERERQLRELRRENDQLRKLVADLSLERDALRDALELARIRARSDAPVPPNLVIINGGDAKA